MGTKKGRRNIRKNNGRTKKRAIRRPLSKRKEGKKTIRKHKGHKGKNTTRRKRLSGGMFGIGDKKYIRETINGIRRGKIDGKKLENFKAFFNKPGNQKYKSTRIENNDAIFNEQNDTPLHMAVRQSKSNITILPEDIIEMLASGPDGEKARSMKSTFDPPKRYKSGKENVGDGNTPLHLAVINRLPTNIIKLLAEEIQTNDNISPKLIMNNEVQTPLFIAVEMYTSNYNNELLKDIIKILADGQEGEKSKKIKCKIYSRWRSSDNEYNYDRGGSVGGNDSDAYEPITKYKEEMLTPYELAKNKIGLPDDIIRLLKPDAEYAQPEELSEVETPPENETPNTVEDEEFDGFTDDQLDDDENLG
jgi:hypothetical protein